MKRETLTESMRRLSDLVEDQATSDLDEAYSRMTPTFKKLMSTMIEMITDYMFKYHADSEDDDYTLESNEMVDRAQHIYDMLLSHYHGKSYGSRGDVGKGYMYHPKA